ncbi:MAG: OmpH family outer membrane protein [Treponema sp.]|nr:OmpH family outer membrane protein [Treponema sp.]
MLKKVLFLSVLFFCGTVFIFGQQITRIAVIDLPRIYAAFFHLSRDVRQLEERIARFQSDIERLTGEIQDLRSRHADAVLNNNDSEALRLENLIQRRTEFLRDFHQTRTTEIENERSRLMQTPSFLNQLQDEIRFVAEREGFSIVLNLHNNPSVLWFSNAIDITDRVIQSMQTRARN